MTPQEAQTFIKARILEHFSDASAVEITASQGLHDISIGFVSEAFTALSHVQREQKVYAIFFEEVRNQLFHSVRLNLSAPSEC